MEKIIYTDGSSIKYRGSFAWVIPHGNFMNEIIPGRCTNQRAELYAIYSALLHNNDDKIHIMTDSMYSIGCLTLWVDNWKINNWRNAKGKDVKNKEIIKETLNLMSGRDVKFSHVKAHSGIKYNEMADMLARKLL